MRMKFLAIVALACLVCSIKCQISLNLDEKCREITIRGKVKDNADNFGIDLHTSSGKIPFHLNARFGSKWGDQVPYIVLNSNDGTQWNTEVNKGTSLKPGSVFKLRIFFNENNFDVYLDDEYFNTLPWRMDFLLPIFGLQNFIRIVGDVTVTSVARSFYPSSVLNVLPFSIPLDQVSEISIKGRIADKADNFEYYLSGLGRPFVVEYRYSENVLVLSNYNNLGALDYEQKEKLPVARGQTFSHKIEINSGGAILIGKDFRYAFARPFNRPAENLYFQRCPTTSSCLSLSKVTITKRF